MNNKYTYISNYLLIITFLSFLPSDTQAKPVKADEILSYPKEWQTEFSVFYTNILKKSAREAPVLIEQPNGTFIGSPQISGKNTFF